MKFEYEVRLNTLGCGCIEISDDILNNLSKEEKDKLIIEEIKKNELKDMKIKYSEFIPCIVKFARNTMFNEELRSDPDNLY